MVRPCGPTAGRELKPFPLRGLMWVFLLFTSLSPSDPVWGQEPVEEVGRVEGRVSAEDTGVPLPGAMVQVQGTELRARTNDRGRYVLSDVPAGARTLEVNRIGYSDVILEVAVEPGGRTVADVQLPTDALGLDPIVVLSQRTRMVGDPLNLSVIPGAAHFLSLQDLETRRVPFDDVHQILRRIPGVNVQDEEGYGLRPNIGMRGTGVSRSSKVTIMEDGVLIAPAPYAAPAAYYFPVTARMEAVEVRKGSSQIRYGPRTIGGALNLVSTSIPEERSWEVDTRGGEDRTFRVLARAGDSWDRFGWLVETYQIQTDGYKELQGGGDTGFQVGDYMAKLRFNTDREAPRYQEVELKVGYHDELSEETYLGLTTEDFRRSPLLRYPASAPDVMDTEHVQLQLRHFFQPSRRMDVTTTLYRNDFARNWYKLHSVRGASISSVLDDPAGYSQELATLRGADSEADAFMVRANNREYLSQGVQSTLGLRLETGPAEHDMELGIRLHQDREDRFQWEDGYRMVDGRAVRTSQGTPGTQDNRVGEAQAVSAYVQNQIQAGRWILVPGVRYERAALTRTDYPTDPPSRRTPTRTRETTVSSFIPGVGAVFTATPTFHIFSGVHRGYAPPGPGAAPETRPERSVNYELGTRIRRSGLALQVSGFFSDYTNILGEATLATGEQGRSDLFNGGAVHTLGLETSLDYDLAWDRDLPLQIPVTLAYTVTQATFQSSFESDFGPWGNVEEGDHLPYLPRHQLSGSLAVEDAGSGVTLSATGASTMRTRAGTGPVREEASTDAYLILDLQAEYTLSRGPGGTVYGGVQNLTDRRYIVARRPAGARPGLPRTLFLGLRMSR